MEPRAEPVRTPVAGWPVAAVERTSAGLRIAVLERIATDGRETRLLSDEIEKLREK